MQDIGIFFGILVFFKTNTQQTSLSFIFHTNTAHDIWPRPIRCELSPLLSCSFPYYLLPDGTIIWDFFLCFRLLETFRILIIWNGCIFYFDTDYACDGLWNLNLIRCTW